MFSDIVHSRVSALVDLPRYTPALIRVIFYHGILFSLSSVAMKYRSFGPIFSQSIFSQSGSSSKMTSFQASGFLRGQGYAPLNAKALGLLLVDSAEE